MGNCHRGRDSQKAVQWSVLVAELSENLEGMKLALRLDTREVMLEVDYLGMKLALSSIKLGIL